MPDLSVNKSSSKADLKRSANRTSGKEAHSSTTRHNDNKYSNSKGSKSPARHRARRSRSSSSSDSSSDSDSSASGSSSSSKPSPTKSSKQVADNRKSTNQPTEAHLKSDGQNKAGDTNLPKSSRDIKKLAIPVTSGTVEPESNISEQNNKTNDLSTAVGQSTASHVQEHEKTQISTGFQKSQNRDKPQLIRTPKDDILDKNTTIGDGSKEDADFTRIVVDKLTKNITKAHIQEIFSIWGEIKSVDLPPDRIHPEFNRGYSYIEYNDHKSASDAVTFMNGGQIDGQEVLVTEVRSHAKQSNDRPIKRRSPDGRPGSRKRKLEHFRFNRGRSRERSINAPRKRDRSRQREDSERRRDSRAHGRLNERSDRNHLRDRDRRDRMHRRSAGPRRVRRGSSGSPFANRSIDRQRSPLPGQRYRRPSPPGARTSARRPRSRTPTTNKPQSANPRGDVNSKPVGTTAPRRDRKGSRSSSSSSSSSSNSSSSSSDSGSSSSSSSTSSRSRS